MINMYATKLPDGTQTYVGDGSALLYTYECCRDLPESGGNTYFFIDNRIGKYRNGLILATHTLPNSADRVVGIALNRSATKLFALVYLTQPTKRTIVYELRTNDLIKIWEGMEFPITTPTSEYFRTAHIEVDFRGYVWYSRATTSDYTTAYCFDENTKVSPIIDDAVQGMNINSYSWTITKEGYFLRYYTSVSVASPITYYIDAITNKLAQLQVFSGSMRVRSVAQDKYGNLYFLYNYESSMPFGCYIYCYIKTSGTSWSSATSISCPSDSWGLFCDSDGYLYVIRNTGAGRAIYRTMCSENANPLAPTLWMDGYAGYERRSDPTGYFLTAYGRTGAV